MHDNRTLTSLIVLTALATFGICAPTDAAHARERTGSVQTEHGAKIEKKIAREKGSRSKSTTITGTNGQTVTRERTTTRQEDGTLSTTATRTGPQGKTQTLEKIVAPTGDDAAHITKTITGENGEAVTIEKDVIKATPSATATETPE